MATVNASIPRLQEGLVPYLQRLLSIPATGVQLYAPYSHVVSSVPQRIGLIEARDVRDVARVASWAVCTAVVLGVGWVLYSEAPCGNLDRASFLPHWVSRQPEEDPGCPRRVA